MKNKAALTSVLARLKVTAKVSRNEDLLSETATQSELCKTSGLSEYCIVSYTFCSNYLRKHL